MASGLHVTALQQFEFAEVAQHMGFARTEAALAEERQRPPQLFRCLLVTALPPVNNSESVQLTGLSGVDASL
jgi:hypothetical protein